jgi:2,3-dihydroxybenzoate decarboxylase
MRHRRELLGHDVEEELINVSNTRIASMNETGIAFQVLSMTMPGPQGLDAKTATAVALDANERMAGAMRSHPDRFGAFACLPTPDVAASVKELERTVTKLGFKGAMINGHTNGEFLDDKKYWPIFEAAQSLDVPVYMHPRDPHPAAKVYFDGYPELASAAWGFTMDTVAHFLRICFSGVFESFPKLKFMLGHNGEGLPFYLDRLENHTAIGMKEHGFKKTITDIMQQNVIVTTSGNFSVPALMCTVAVLGIDRVIFSVDWPYESNKVGVDFLNSLPLSAADLEKLAHGNAEKLLKLPTA